MLSNWLNRLMGMSTSDDVVHQERAVRVPWYPIVGTLDGSLAEIVMPDYSDRLRHARNRLLDNLGGPTGPYPEQ